TGASAALENGPDGPIPALDARILVVEDEEQNLRALARILSAGGYGSVRAISDSRRALEEFRAFQPDLILLDLHMPLLDGFDVLALLRPEIPPTSYLPVIMLTGDSRAEIRQRALSAGVGDFLLKPFDVVEVLLRIANQLKIRSLQLPLATQNRDLEHLVLARTRELEDAQVEVLERLASAGEYRDDDTGRHVQRVAALSEALARARGLGEMRASLIRRAAPLHDIGKIGIPDEILLKPGRLTEAEFAVMRNHTTIGARILHGGRSDLMRLAERIAHSHHERWDGAGYPTGLAGDAIPIEARLVAIADFFDALTHDRPYRPAWPLNRVLAEIALTRGRHFDPAVADTFLALD